ncbi:MAG: 30S ribosomal protein S12 methylthiotransferase RimO [Clostridia bacterium]|nr:30S ribosomal protein S12 methylthiotransferase RimO [Clostridia bacterium]
MNNVCIVSLGCAKNLTDSEIMLAKLNSHGYTLTNDESKAEIIVVNTCCFIDSAKQESIDTILDVAKNKTEGKLKYLIVAGCMGERYGKEILDELPEVDAVCGTGDFDDICSVIDKAVKKRDIYIKGCMAAPLECDERIIATPPYTAYLKIAEGCDNKCTYCVIPSIRGKYRSRKIENVISEAEKLVNNGVKEIILIAQDTSSYGIDLYGEPCLGKLLTELCKLDKLHWLRVHYLYPEKINEELLNVFSSEDKLLNYFDIPIQHISDSVLKRMGRKTKGSDIRKVISSIREKCPDSVIRTSLITGFPGETDDNFTEMIEFLREYKLERVGVFPFSCEEGTPAAKLDNQIDEDIKNERFQRLSEIIYEVSEEQNESVLGKQVKVLVEGKDNVLKMYYGRTYGDSIDVDPKVFFKSDKLIHPGEFVDIRITDYIDCDLVGDIID